MRYSAKGIYIFIFYFAQSSVAQQIQQQVLQCTGILNNKFLLEPPLRKSNFSYGRFTFIPFEKIVGDDICEQIERGQPQNVPAPTQHLHFQQVMTQCTNCTSCSSGLKAVLTYLLNFIEPSKLWMIVLVRGSREAYELPQFDSASRLRVVFIGEDTQIAITDCQVVDEGESDTFRSFSKTSVLFVSVSFIILMVVSLAWLIIYYVQRFRYANAKDRLQRRLFNAAKRALSKIPTRSVRVGDKELDADCPVCIDPYQTGDIIRSLPCKHVFHKTCVDLWLLEHRTCPMCKSDILKAMGYRVSRTRKKHPPSTGTSVRARPNNVERLTVDVHAAPAEQAAQTQTENPEPFNYTPSASPPFVQLLTDCSNARTFSIIPLTVHRAPSSCSEPRQPLYATKACSEQDKLRHPLPPPIARRSTEQLVDLVAIANKQNTSSRLVDVVHPRSRSLSHMLYFERENPTVTVRSQTYSTALDRETDESSSKPFDDSKPQPSTGSEPRSSSDAERQLGNFDCNNLPV